MVRCKMIGVVVALLLAMAMPTAAMAADATPYDGSISTTYITIFRDLATKVSIFDDYVFFRSGQNEYVMYVGDISYENGKFAGKGLTVYTITNETNYNSVYNYSISTRDLDLSAGSALIYSNLGQYPDLIERNDYYAFATLTLLFIALCCYLLRSVFGFSLRSRR